MRSLKSYISDSQKQKLHFFKEIFFNKPVKYFFLKKIQSRHRRLIAKIKKKETINVLFLVIQKSVWKVDPVFTKMLTDPYFNPIILVCPFTTYGSKKMMEELKASFDYFYQKGYPVVNSYDSKTKTWVKLESLSPDILFFTNPHNLTKPEYYYNAYNNYISFYLPYYFMGTNHAGKLEDIYNSKFMLSMYKIFWPSRFHYNIQKTVCFKNINNGVVSGYPATEILLSKSNSKRNYWKANITPKKKIIFAPHHTIEKSENSLSSFLTLSEFMKKLVDKYSEFVQWSFKPHPILKPKLYCHPDWGKEKTEEYYNFWKINKNTQLDEGEYDMLFCHSDAIIHDSSSFIIEYAFTGKPGMLLMEIPKSKYILNGFGKMFLSNYRISLDFNEIENFVLDVISQSCKVKNNEYLKEYINEYYVDKMPSDFIINSIKSSLTNFNNNDKFHS
ncbi:CDP-glycerol glycerophosphotransferase family protein [Flavobacteriaceae bacterium]|nr:CDP-glycerol glycerophosphotransferase family protein [Flavobacteriaceae bacterium]